MWNSGTTGSSFNWCDISGVANYGVPDIASAALIIHGTTTITVSNCKISGLSGNSVSGIYVHNSQNVRIYKTLLQNNREGVVGNAESNIFFGPNGGGLTLDCNHGNNIITGNTTDGVHANNFTTINLNAPSYNYNDVSNNMGYNAVAWGNSTIYASGNYWGVTTPPPPKIYGNVLWDNNIITCVPTAPRLSVGVIEENNPINIGGMLNKATNTSSDIELLQTAFELLDSEKYDEALSIFKSIVSTYKDNEFVYGNALVGISGICKITRDKELLEYLKVCSKAEKAFPIAKRVYAGALSGLGYYDEAISEYEVIAKSYPGTDHEVQALVGLSYTYLVCKKDVEKAQEILTEVKKVAKEDDINVKFLNGSVSQAVVDLQYTDADKVIKLGIELLGAENYVEALNIFKLVVSTYINYDATNISEYRACGIALGAIAGLCQQAAVNEDSGLGDFKDLLEYLKATIKDNEKAPIDHKLMYASALRKVGYVNESIFEYEEILKSLTSKDEYYQGLILNEIYIIYLHYLKDPKKADETLERINQINNKIVSVDELAELPTEYSLLQNYPNPFNPTTTMQYTIPKDEYVKLVVYDVTGKVVKELVNGYKVAGKYNVEFNSSGYASGIYYYRIEAGAYKNVQKMMLLK